MDSFWRINPFPLKAVAYDVPVGGFFPIPQTTPHNLAADWEYLASFKLDMVGFTDNEIIIFEVKHTSKPAAIGQLLVYDHLFRLNYTGRKSVELVLLAFQVKPIIEDVCSNFDIQVIEVPIPPESQHFGRLQGFNEGEEGL